MLQTRGYCLFMCVCVCLRMNLELRVSSNSNEAQSPQMGLSLKENWQLSRLETHFLRKNVKTSCIKVASPTVKTRMVKIDIKVK